MRTEKISAQVVKNYKNLVANVTTPQPKQKNNLVLWGLNYNKNKVQGDVTQFGFVSRGKAEIRIVGDTIQKIKKPFFSTWNRTLKKINTMLQDINANKNNKEVVKQNNLEIFVFDRAEVDKMAAETNKKIKK